MIAATLLDTMAGTRPSLTVTSLIWLSDMLYFFSTALSICAEVGSPSVPTVLPFSPAGLVTPLLPEMISEFSGVGIIAATAVTFRLSVAATIVSGS